MEKFRSLKSKLISSKRDSQKIDEQELCSFTTEQPSLSRINFSMTAKLQADIHTITEENYKLTSHTTRIHSTARTNLYQQSGPQKTCILKSHQREEAKKSSGSKKQRERLELEDKENENAFTLDSKGTVKKGSSPANNGDPFGRIIEIMRKMNHLQQKNDKKDSQGNPLLNDQIKEKLAEFKELITAIEDKSQRHLLDFYNQQTEHRKSSDSFHSQSSGDTYQINSERQAYELTDKTTNEVQDQIQIKYRRISLRDTTEDENEAENGTPINDTFFEEIDEDEGSHGLWDSPINEASDKNIVHLFSYDKQRYLDSPLSKISERESQYYSPESKHCPTNDMILGESLEYKKIYYLLETSQKKNDKIISTRQDREVAQFMLDSASSRSMLKSSKKMSDIKDRSRCHEQLEQMISLLENKYKRKVRGAENVMDSLNQAMSDKTIRPRIKK